MPHVEARMAELFDVALSAHARAFTRDELKAAVADCDVFVPTVTDEIGAEVIAAAGERLKLIANFGAGVDHIDLAAARAKGIMVSNTPGVFTERSEEHTSELQSLMRISYAVFCLKKKKRTYKHYHRNNR